MKIFIYIMEDNKDLVTVERGEHTIKKFEKCVTLADLYHEHNDQLILASQCSETDELIEARKRFDELTKLHSDEIKRKVSEIDKNYEIFIKKLTETIKHRVLPIYYSELFDFTILELELLIKQCMGDNLGIWNVSTDRFREMIGIHSSTVVLSKVIILKHLYADTGKFGCSKVTHEHLSDDDYKSKLLLYLKRYYCFKCLKLGHVMSKCP